MAATAVLERAGTFERRDSPMAYSVDLAVLARRESEQVEWKENVADTDDVVATISAFANDLANLGGGYVVCGAREETDAHGFPVLRRVGLTAPRLKEIEGRVMDDCQKRVSPAITPRVEMLPADEADRRVLVFMVPATGQAHQFRTRKDGSKYYVRRSRSTVEARNGTLRELLVSKGASQPWDRRCHPRATVDDIDLIAFRDLLHQLGLWTDNHALDHYLDPDNAASPFVPSFFDREPLTGTLRPRNFTLLLAGRNVQRFYPEAHAIFSIYPGEDRSEPFAERLELDGTLIAQARRLIERLNTEAVTVIDKSSGAPPNVSKYPRHALHEAVVNALVHRDYEAAHPVRVTAFSNRVTIWSPGALLRVVEPEQFRAGRAAPVWRNQALAWILVKLKLAQAEGQGIATILRSMDAEGCPPPEFHLTTGSIECVLPAHPRHHVMRDLQRAEQLLALGRFDEASERVERLLALDPFNFRVIELFCDICGAAGRPERVMAFVQSLGERAESLPPIAKERLAEYLWDNGSGASLDKALSLHESVARTLRDDLGTARRATERIKANDPDGALAILDESLALDTHHESRPALLHLKALVQLSLARRCQHTALTTAGLSARLRAKTESESARWLDEADRSLRAALASGPEPALRGRIEGTLADLTSQRSGMEPLA